MIGIQVWKAVEFTVTFNPDTRFAAMFLIVYPKAVAAGAPPVQVPREDPVVVQGGHIYQGHEGWQGGWEGLTNNTLLAMAAISSPRKSLCGKGGAEIKTISC